MLSSAYWELFRMYKRNVAAKKQVLQVDMNLKMLGGIFEIDAKYSFSMAIIFMAHLYYGPLPLLCPLLAVFFLVQYWLDKLYLTKFARKPPHFHANLHNIMIKILPFCVFFHCGFSLWAYGNPQIWPEGVETRVEDGIKKYYVEDRSFGERIFNENSFLHFIFL